MTTYQILRQVSGSPDYYEPIGHIEAHSAEAAIRQGVEDESGTYVAIPAKSWRPLQVSVQTRKTVSVEPVAKVEQ